MRRLRSVAIIFAFLLAFAYAFAATSNNAKAALEYSNRIYGADRYATAVAVSKAGWVTSENVILVSGENFPDGLAAALLAKHVDAPILLTRKDSLPSVVSQEIQRLKAKNIYILGSSGVVSKAIEDGLKAEGYNVERIAGVDRYDTAVKVCEKVGSSFDKVILATGNNYPDALSVGAFAAANGWPILFTGDGSLNKTTKSALVKLNVKKVDIIGTTGVVSASVEKELKDMGIAVNRIAGADRELTSLAIAKNYGSSYNGVILVTGWSYADALAAAPLAAKVKYPILLVSKNAVKDEISDYVSGLADNKLVKVIVIGSSGVVSEDVLNNVTDIVNKDKVVGIASSATFGGKVTVSINVKGSADYPTAAKYQVYDGQEAISAKANIGSATTVYPAKKAGDAVTVKLYDSNDKEVGSVDVVLTGDQADEVVGIASSATFGGKVTVSINVKGSADYPTAAKYQVYDGQEAISAKANIGSATTVYPAKKAGDTVTVKLYDSNDKEVGSVDVVLTGDQADEVVGIASSATFGGKVTVSINVKGSADYPTAAKYQVYDGQEAISAKANIGSATTVYPAKKAGDTVTVKLYDSNDKEVGSVDVVLQ